MIRFLYNVIQHLALVVLALPLALLVAMTPRYRGRVLARLGRGLQARVAALPAGRKRIWVHALSVGEVSSVVSLVCGLRKNYPEAQILLSTSTKSGARYRSEALGNVVDLFCDFPFDHFWVVRRFMRIIEPDLFIQVETDFWPNLLAAMQRSKAAAILVNGRISAASFTRYQRFAFFFAPLFDSFALLSMQTTADVEKMVALGLSPAKVCALGNLKIDAALPNFKPRPATDKARFTLPSGRTAIVVGSTHPGEEALLAPCFARLHRDMPEVFFVIAPRNIERASEIASLFGDLGFAVARRSEPQAAWDGKDLLIVDTMGELVDFYQQGDLAYVGGSLVPFGGHNPLEPAAFGKPVFFGPHMADFADIVTEMLAEQAAYQVADVETLCRGLQDLLGDDDRRRQAGEQASRFVRQRQGVTERHLEVIAKLF